MFKLAGVFKKELERVKKEEPFFKDHNGLWRYFFKWKKLMHSNSVEARLPWISFPVIEFLDENVKKGSRIFEYGGGGSSVFFTDKGATVFTVEHNKEWFEILRKNLEKNNNWKGIFVEPEKDDGFKIDFSNPDLYFSSEENFKGYNFKKYASSIDAFEEFDFVLVDGRARPSCMKHGIKKLKKGGFLILDNSDRLYYTAHFKNILQSEFSSIIEHSGPTPFCSWFNRTSVWRKNS